jgi:tetratricopeptide (TPR) repeat protein
MNEESLFHEALARSTPRERAAFLDEACAGQPELRAAVESLLAAHERPEAFLSAQPILVQEQANDSGSARGSNPLAAQETANPADSTGADSVPAVAPGDAPSRVGRYEVRRLLGRGGMGSVYLAHDPELDRPVALKVPQLAGPDAEERFLREARAAAALSHPNLCPVYDVGRADGVLYLAMAYLPGPTLTEVIRQQGPLPPARSAAIAAAVARGMAEAHRHGIVHRDLKPGNILLDHNGEPVITDFGLALRASVPAATTATTVAYQPRLTEAGVLMGTPAYMPPEQARGELERIGPASDVYALGAILFELLTGRLLFPACPLHEMVRLIETQPAPSPSAIRRGVPPGLDAVCRRALAKEPTQRFGSMEDFAAALAPFATRRRPWGRVAVAAAVLALLAIAAGAVIYVKTDNGTVEIRLSDPAAAVEVAVDGNEITLTANGRVTKVRAGGHALLVKGPDFETEARTFNVTRGEKKVVEVELRPKPAAAVTKPEPLPLSPERARLARLLASCREAFEQRRWDDLGRLAREAIQIDPESPGALAFRGHDRAIRNDLRGAREDLDAALKLNPESSYALTIRGTMSLKENRDDDAIADLTVAMRLDPNPRLWLARALAYSHKGEYRQVIADATHAIKVGFQGPEAHRDRATAHANLGEYKEALADYATALLLGPSHARIWLQRSALYVKMGDAARAAADWEQARALNPALRIEDRPVVPDPPKPVQRKKLSPAESAALVVALEEAEKALRENRSADALKSIETAIHLDPAEARPHAQRSWLLHSNGKFKEAIAVANEAIHLDPTYAIAYFWRGHCRGQLADYAGAIADYTIALRLDSQSAQAWGNRCHCYLQRGQYHQAVADATEAARLDETWLGNRGVAYLYLGEDDKALADFARMADLQPTNSLHLRWSAAVRARRGDLDGAAKDRERALQRDPQSANAPVTTLPQAIPPVKKDPELPPGNP